MPCRVPIRCGLHSIQRHNTISQRNVHRTMLAGTQGSAMDPCTGLTLLVSLATIGGLSAQPIEHRLPDHVKVLGVFFRPKDQPRPSPKVQELLMEHLRLTRRRYHEMLGGRDTFALADEKAHVYDAEHDLAHYKTLPQNGAPQYTSELLTQYHVSRFACPYVFVIVIVNPKGHFPNGGGRPINGGLSLGGGIVILSSYHLERPANLQSTLEHELGHSFGLLHVNAYGRNIRTNDSIMSYNRAHHSKGLELSKTPGILIPEDIRALALNGRVFRKLTVDPARDLPAGYTLAPIRWLGPMQLPGQPANAVKATSTSPPDSKSRVTTIVQNHIRPNRMDVKFDRRNMWVADADGAGWTRAEIEFPFPVTLSRMSIHSQICGITHEATAVRIEAKKGDAFKPVLEQPLSSANAQVAFGPATGQTWRLRFKAGSSGKVLIRGLRFFEGDEEIFPPFVPYSPTGP